VRRIRKIPREPEPPAAKRLIIIRNNGKFYYDWNVIANGLGAALRVIVFERITVVLACGESYAVGRVAPFLEEGLFRSRGDVAGSGIIAACREAAHCVARTARDVWPIVIIPRGSHEAICMIDESDMG
jgi:hypothetical protein